jgi:hypothetical protein
LNCRQFKFFPLFGFPYLWPCRIAFIVYMTEFVNPLDKTQFKQNLGPISPNELNGHVVFLVSHTQFIAYLITF